MLFVFYLWHVLNTLCNGCADNIVIPINKLSMGCFHNIQCVLKLCISKNTLQLQKGQTTLNQSGL